MTQENNETTEEDHVTPLERGVYRAPVLIGGRSILYAVTSSGEKFAEVRMLPGLKEWVANLLLRQLLEEADPEVEEPRPLAIVR